MKGQIWGVRLFHTPGWVMNEEANESPLDWTPVGTNAHLYDWSPAVAVVTVLLDKILILF